MKFERLPEIEGFSSRLNGLFKLLLTIYEFSNKFGRYPYTRELLNYLKSWGHGFELLKIAEEFGLIERYVDYCLPGSNRKCIFNKLSGKGLKLLKMILELISS